MLHWILHIFCFASKLFIQLLFLGILTCNYMGGFSDLFIDFAWTIIWDLFIVEYPPSHEPGFAGMYF